MTKPRSNSPASSRVAAELSTQDLESVRGGAYSKIDWWGRESGSDDGTDKREDDGRERIFRLG